MTFAHAWALILLLLPGILVAWQWRRSARRAGLVLKAITLALVVLAVAEPRLAIWETRMAVVVLVDTSASVSGADLAAASRIANEIESARGRNFVRVVPFARHPRPPYPAESHSGWRFRHTRGAAGRATNLEAAVLDAIALMPAEMIPRVVLISDGNENQGSITRAVWQARELGVPVDVYPLAGRKEPELRLESVSYPTIAYAGERFPIDLTVHSPGKASGRLTITAEGRRLGAGSIKISAGENRLRVYAKLNTGGAFDITGSLRAGKLGELRFAQAVTIRKPKVLYLSQDPPGSGVHLLQALTASRFAIDRKNQLPHSGLGRYQVIILNNWNLEGIEAAVKTRLGEFVQDGGGLLVIGGERNVYAESAEKQQDPLERVLPAKLAPPRSPEGTCVVLIIDKSSSMEGRKMELARRAAIGVVNNLRPDDRVGVLIFDNTFRWTVPIRRAEAKNLIKRLISGITADGGTQIAPALAEAYRKVLSVRATYKHIVLLTDGISEEGNSVALAREAARQRVTISTVGLGQDVNKSYLEKIAMYAGGEAYFLSDPSGLVRILLRDVREHTGKTAVEKAVTVTVARPAEILRGISIKGAPPLMGYVRFEAKPSAETILKVAPKYPLLVRWQYGLGRSAVFASDAKSRWAAKWVTWSGFDLFWTNLVRDLLPHSSEGEARITYNRANAELVIEYRLGPDLPARRPWPEVYVFGPGNFREPLNLQKVASGAYRATVAIGSRRGFFRVRPLADSRAFPESGIYLQEKELTDFGSNKPLLRRITGLTGGKFAPKAAAIFESNGKAIASSIQLWPGLLLLAILLNLVELVIRKWRGLTTSLVRRRA